MFLAFIHLQQKKQNLSLSPNAMVNYDTDFSKWYLDIKISFGFRTNLILFPTPRKLYCSLRFNLQASDVGYQADCVSRCSQFTLHAPL